MFDNKLTNTNAISQPLNETIVGAEHRSDMKKQLINNKKKIYFSSLVLFILIFSFKRWEVTSGSECILEVAKDRALVIFAQEAGVLKEINVKDGDYVEEGAVLGICEDLDIEKQIVRLNAELEQLHSQSVNLQSSRMEQLTVIDQARNLYNQYNNEAEELRLEETAISSIELGEKAVLFPPELLELTANMEAKKIEEQTQKLEKQRYESLFQQGLISQSQLEVISNRYQISVKERKAAESRISAMKISHARKTKTLSAQEKMASLSLQAASQKLSTLDAEMKLVDEQLSTKQSELGLLKKKNSLLIIKAPRAGIVFGQNIEKKRGQYLERGMELCRLADISQLRAIAEISEWDVVRVQPDTLVRLRMRSLSDKIYQGRIGHISSEAAVNQETKGRVYYCEIIIANSDNTLRPGMSGFARVVLGSAPGYSFLLRWIKRSVRLDYWT